jgi:hypothetical protein
MKTRTHLLRLLLAPCFLCSFAAAGSGLGPIFPVQGIGEQQLAIRPDGTAALADVSYLWVASHTYLHEALVSQIAFGATNQSSFQGYSPAEGGPLLNPDVAVNAANGIAVYANHHMFISDEGNYYKISLFQFDTNGTPTTPITNLTDYALSRDTGHPPAVRADMNRAGRMAVVYFSETAKFQLPLYEEYIYAQLLETNSSPVAPAVLVNQRLIAYRPVVAVTPDGGAVVAWEDASISEYSYDAGHDIYARRIDPNGNPIGNEFRVNSAISGRHGDAEIAIATNGSFAILWTQSSSDADGVYLQRFNADGNRLGPEMRVSPYNGVDPQVAMSADGRFIVAWQGQDGDGSGIFAQRFLADGSFHGGPLWVNEGATNSQTTPLLALADDGTFIAKWMEGTNHFARWITWDATNQTQILGPRVQSLSPAFPAAPLADVTVTFDRLMNPAAFATTNAHLVDPVGRIIPVTSVQTTNDQTFTLGFAGRQLPGRYYVEIAPTIQDANGVMMDENGNTIGGESADAFRGNFTLTSSVTAAFPLTEGFESDPDALAGWSFDSAVIGGLVFSTNTAPHGGTNHLKFTSGPIESATLTVNLSSQAGQTNLFLSFWAKQNSYLYQLGDFHVQLSGDAQTWHPIPVTDPSTTYTEYVVDLVQAAATNGVALDGDVYIRFVYDYSFSGLSLYLDDVRVMAGELPIGPKVLGLNPAQWAATNVTLHAVTVTFDQPIDPATFTGADVALNGAQGFTVSNVSVLPVAGSGNTQFNLTFPDQSLRGVYQLTIGPDIADASGHLMNQNGNAANGEPGDFNGEAADYYTGTITFAPAAGTTVRGPIVFEETFENWGSVPTYWSFAPFRLGPGDARYPQFPGALNPGGTMFISTDSHRGGAALAVNISGSYTTDAESVTLALDLSGQTGQTNLFLEFWAKTSVAGWPIGFGSLYVEASSDAQTWGQILWVSGPSSYTQFTLDLDQALAAHNIPLSGTVNFRFRYVKPASTYSPNSGTLFLDDIRIVLGNHSVPALAAPSRTGNGQFQFELTGPSGSNYVIQASTNLINWVPIATAVIPASGVITIVDPYATNFSRRFYRAARFSAALIAPVMSALIRLGGGQMQLQLSGMAGSNYIIHASTNLADWTPIATNLIPAAGIVTVTDSAATNYSRRFYRAVVE